jgi:hypothetical protein
MDRAYRYAQIDFRTQVARYTVPGPPNLEIGTTGGDPGFVVSCFGQMSGLVFTCSGDLTNANKTKKVTGKFIFNPTGDKITGFSFDNEESDFLNTRWKTHLDGGNIPITSKDSDGFDLFELKGPGACKALKRAEWNEYWDKGASTMTSWGCNSRSSLSVWMNIIKPTE